MTPENYECAKFFYEKLLPAVTNLYNTELPEITPAHLRLIRDEISLFLGDDITYQAKADGTLVPLEVKHGLRLCEYTDGAIVKTGWFHEWSDGGAIIEFEGGVCAYSGVYNVRFLDTPPLPEVKE